MARGGHVKRGTNARSRDPPGRSTADMSTSIPPVADQNIPLPTGTSMSFALDLSGTQVPPSVHGTDGRVVDRSSPPIPHTSTPIAEDMSPHLPPTPPVGPSASAPGSSTTVAETSIASNDGRMLVWVENGKLEPQTEAGRIIFGIFKQKLHPMGTQWKLVPQDVIEFYWQEFLKACRCVPSSNLKKAWTSLAARRYSDNLSGWKKQGKKPSCVPTECWESWQRDWATPEFTHRSQVASANRRSETGGPGAGMSKHSGGSISTSKHTARLEKKLGRKPTPHEVFLRLHTKAGTSGVLIDQRSQQINDRYNELYAKASVNEDGSPVDPDSIDEAQLYYEAVGGEKKRRLYGLGTQASGFYPHLSPGSSSSGGTSSLDSGFDERVRSTLKEEIRNEVRDELRTELRTEIRGELRSELCTEIRGEVQDEMQAMRDQLAQLTTWMQNVMHGRMPSGTQPPSDPTGSFPPPPTDGL